MNRHNGGTLLRLAAAAALLVLTMPVSASDFTCLRALIPASDHFGVKKNRNKYSVPELTASGSAIAISEWDGEWLSHVFVYTETGSKRFSRIQILGAKPVPLASLETDWLHTHVIAIPLDNMEVFRIHPERPSKKAKPKTAGIHDEPELGGILVDDGKSSAGLSEPIKEEIQLRLKWIRDNNLDSRRFMKWSKAQPLCPHAEK